MTKKLMNIISLCLICIKNNLFITDSYQLDMKQEEISSKTNEELNNELIRTKKYTGALIGILVVLWSVILYGLIAEEEKGTFIDKFG